MAGAVAVYRFVSARVRKSAMPPPKWKETVDELTRQVSAANINIGWLRDDRILIERRMKNMEANHEEDRSEMLRRIERVGDDVAEIKRMLERRS